MYWTGHMSAAGWILSVLWTLIIIALVVAGVLWPMSASRNRDNRGAATAASGPAAREILDRRLARGELTVEQYKQLRDTLGDHGPTVDGRGDHAPTTPGTGPTRAAGKPG